MRIAGSSLIFHRLRKKFYIFLRKYYGVGTVFLMKNVHLCHFRFFSRRTRPFESALISHRFVLRARPSDPDIILYHRISPSTIPICNERFPLSFPDTVSCSLCVSCLTYYQFRQTASEPGTGKFRKSVFPCRSHSVFSFGQRISKPHLTSAAMILSSLYGSNVTSNYRNRSLSMTLTVPRSHFTSVAIILSTLYGFISSFGLCNRNLSKLLTVSMRHLAPVTVILSKLYGFNASFGSRNRNLSTHLTVCTLHLTPVTVIFSKLYGFNASSDSRNRNLFKFLRLYCFI